MNDLVAIEKIAQWEKLKTLVLDSVSSPITKRVYNMALNEFMVWFQQAPRPGFTKATVNAWRVSLEDRHLGSSSIIIRMSAIRKLAADNGLLAPELAQGISRSKEREIDRHSRRKLAVAEAGASSPERTLSAVFKKSGVKKAHAHRYRHTLATRLLADGASFERVADILGNSPAVVRKHYGKWSKGRQDNIDCLMFSHFETGPATFQVTKKSHEKTGV